LAIAAGLLALSIAATPSPTAERKFVFVDLKPKVNHKLTDRFGRIEGNTLASLPTGEQTFAGIRFNVEPEVMLLRSPRVPDPRPDKFEGIAVNRTARKLHFLQGTIYGNSNPAISDDTAIAEYTIRYDDGSTATVPVVYGRDVRDWLSPEECRVVRRGQVAWTGENPESVRLERHLYLYLGTWQNPKP